MFEIPITKIDGKLFPRMLKLSIPQLLRKREIFRKIEQIKNFYNKLAFLVFKSIAKLRQKPSKFISYKF